MTAPLPKDILKDLTLLAGARAMESVFATYQLVDDAEQRNELMLSICLLFFGIAIRTTQIALSASDEKGAEASADDNTVAMAVAEILVDSVERGTLPPAGVWARP